MIQNDPNIRIAEDILRGQQAPPRDILTLATALKNEKHFGYARRLLFRARQDSTITGNPQLATKLRQQHALCTYKDPDLPADLKFDRALEILGQSEDLNTTRDQETLGLVGAIYKNKWEAFGQRADLERSLAYYTRGYSEGIASDYGYTAINTAFILDVIADQEMAESRSANASSDMVGSWTAKAVRIRKEIVTELPPLGDRPENAFLKTQWWFYATVAEGFFGLQQYWDALPWLLSGKDRSGVYEWELESTARQLASLARLVSGAKAGEELCSQSAKVLEKFLGTASGVTTAYIGKVGLALSGGGFRAALFHIGVLARLAELDVLRHVEVLSCVSGGSILGAYYYLELRHLLQTKSENDITRQDYIDIMQRIQNAFLMGIQKNIRTRVLANPVANIRMLLFPTRHGRSEWGSYTKSICSAKSTTGCNTEHGGLMI
jgi:Tetratricopeptide Repeats-Sensor/Patatin-like phospholipase